MALKTFQDVTDNIQGIISTVTSISTLLETSIHVCDGSPSGLKTTQLRASRHELLNILVELETRWFDLKPSEEPIPQDGLKALKGILPVCKSRAVKLGEIFEESISTHKWDIGKLRRMPYTGRFQCELFGLKSEVFKLAGAVQAIVDNDKANLINQERYPKLGKIIKRLDPVDFIVSDDGRFTASLYGRPEVRTGDFQGDRVWQTNVVRYIEGRRWNEQEYLSSHSPRLQILHEDDDVAFDVCFVYGSAGDGDDTWTVDSQTMLWSAGLLTKNLHRVRTLTYGCQPHQPSDSLASSRLLIIQAQNLLLDLVRDRHSRNVSSRPLIFICDGVGGLVCKNALFLSHKSQKFRIRNIFNVFKGTVFFGIFHSRNMERFWYEAIQRLVGEVNGLMTEPGRNLPEIVPLQGLTGKDLIRTFLAAEPSFKAICEKAVAQMGKQCSSENLRRLLKSFHKDLDTEARRKAETALANLLRSERERLRISRQLVVQVQHGQEEIQEYDKVNLRASPEGKHTVEKWGTVTSGRAADSQGSEDQDIDDECLASDSDNSAEEDAFAYVSELENFLRGSAAFRTLLKDFMTMLLPTDLRHILTSIPKNDIWASKDQDFSVINSVQAWIEDSTQVRWNWWPFEPRKRLLQDGESRMFWYCTCGVRQWEELSAEQHNLAIRILALSDGQPLSPHWCRNKGSVLSLATWLDGLLQRLLPVPPGATSPSSAAQRYTPRGCPTISSGQAALSGAGGESSISPAQSPQHGPTVDKEDQSAPLGSKNKTWILFGVQGARPTLKPAQISVKTQSTDYSVFQKLKKRYRTNRGRLRLWFSIWRLEFCEVVKFNRWSVDHMVREDRDLPSDVDYQYAPRVPSKDAKNPPISPHLFKAFLDTCSSPCTWPIPHDCMRPPDKMTHFKRVPKRRRRFKEDISTPIWGLEAVFAVSFAYVFIYHCVMVAGPFAFFAWWLTVHPNDVQNASIPVTIVLGALSLFWGSSGILMADHRG